MTQRENSQYKLSVTVSDTVSVSMSVFGFGSGAGHCFSAILKISDNFRARSYKHSWHWCLQLMHFLIQNTGSSDRVIPESTHHCLRWQQLVLMGQEIHLAKGVNL